MTDITDIEVENQKSSAGNELTKGPVMKKLLLFAIPMILGDLLQQCYNIADTLIVGRFLGADALAADNYQFLIFVRKVRQD